MTFRPFLVASLLFVVAACSSTAQQPSPEPAVMRAKEPGDVAARLARLTADYALQDDPSRTDIRARVGAGDQRRQLGGQLDVVALSGTIPAHGFYLVQLAAGSGSTAALPAPDATGTFDLQEGATRVALVTTRTALTGATPSGWVDAIGINDTEGPEGQPFLVGAGQAARRKGGRCTDTNASRSDFDAVAPAPLNTASAAVACACP